MSLLQNIAPFVSDVGSPISAADLTAMRDNVALIDQLTYRITPSFDSSAGIDTGTPGYGKTDGDHYGNTWRVWRGAFRFRSGMTDLTVTGYAQRSTKPSSNETLKIYVNNSGTASATITPAAATFTTTIALSGYTNGQVVPVEIKLEGTIHSADSKMVIYSVYGTPITYTVTSYPGVPSFSGTYSAALLNQLVSATAWLYNRIAAVPIVPGLAQNYALGPYFVSTWPLYYGAVQRSYTSDVLYIRMTVVNPKSPGLRYLVYLNNVLVSTGPTWGVGTHEVFLTLSLSSVSVGSRAEVIIYADLTTQSAEPLLNTRWSILAVRAQADIIGGLSYPYAVLNAVPVGDASITATTLNSFLNNLATTLTAAKARIDAAPHVFSRGYAMRYYYAPRAGQIDNGAISHRARPRFIRLADRLFAAGRDVKLMYGPVSVPVDVAYFKYDDHTFAHTETIIDADKDETTIVYLDSLAGLFPGSAYQIGAAGDLRYCEEIL